MCEEATRISCGPFRVPGTYDVVRSRGMGKITTRALSKPAVVGIVPPNSPTETRSYSKGRFIHLLEAIAGDGLAVHGHDTGIEREDRRLAAGGERVHGIDERAG